MDALRSSVTQEPAIFLHVLDPDEAQAFAQAALALVHADDEADPRELVLLEDMQSEMRLPTQPALLSHEEALAGLESVESPTLARIMLLELVGVATADEHAHPEEMSFLYRAAETLGLQAALVDAYFDFAHRAQSVWQEGRRLILDETREPT